MTTDPVQALIDAGAIPTSPFAPDSRYVGVALGRLPDAARASRALPYVLRRFIPQQRDIAVLLRAHRAAAASGRSCWRSGPSATPSSTGASPTPMR